MDQVKIGKFIATCRKKVGLTQLQLAEKLGITDKAVSKWENGKALPDASCMLALCEILEITVNDLLSGEVVAMENYQKQTEEMLIGMVKEKEERDRMLLKAEVIAGIASTIPLLIATVFVAYTEHMIAEWINALIVFASIVPLLLIMPFLLKIEQKAGYYKCAECGHCYVPTFKSVFMAPHMARTRRMTCPSCGKRSWQKKVLTKE